MAGETALRASSKVLEESQANIEGLLTRGDFDEGDEKVTVRWLMRIRDARAKIKNALRRMERLDAR